MRMDVRRLAAVDMFGAAGTRLRRRIILVEFLLGVLGGVPLGGWVAATASGAPSRVFGIWLAAACLNYLPLALYAIALSASDRLETELEGVDVPAELRHYTVAQLWVLVPLVLVVLAGWQRLRARRSETGGRSRA